MMRKNPRGSFWKLRPGDLPDERILQAEPRLRGLENNPAFRVDRISKRARFRSIGAGYRPILGLNFRIFGELRTAGIGAEDFAIASWGRECRPGTIRNLQRGCFIIIGFLALAAYLGPANIRSAYGPPGPAVAAFYALPSFLALLIGYGWAFACRGIPWSALWLVRHSLSHDPATYPSEARDPRDLISAIAITMGLLVLVAIPIGAAVGLGLVCSVVSIMSGVYEGNWSWARPIPLLAAAGIIASASIGAALGAAHASLMRRRADRIFGKLIERTEKILRDLPDEASWERAARRKS